jgi:hypothetical protein
MSAALFEAGLTVSSGFYVSYEQGKIPVASLATETKIIIFVHNVLEYSYYGDLPSISIEGSLVHVMFSNFEDSRAVLTVAFLAPRRASGLEGEAQGWIWLDQKKEIAVAFLVEYIDDTVPHIASVAQQQCTGSECRATEAQNGCGDLVSFQLAGILSSFSTSNPGSCCSFCYLLVVLVGFVHKQ